MKIEIKMEITTVDCRMKKKKKQIREAGLRDDIDALEL